MMKNKILLRSFIEKEEADDLVELLESSSIEYSIQNIDVNLIPFLQSSSNFSLGLFIDESDIDEYEKLLEKSLSGEEDEVFEKMSDEELEEVLIKFDEWSIEDILISRRILAKRGIAISDNQLLQMKMDRLEDLRKQKAGNPGTTVSGFVFPVIGFILMSWIGMFGYLFYFFSIGIGLNYILDYRRLPQNEKVNVYDKETRTTGIIIIVWAVIVPVLFILFSLRQ
jgi:hypothetical protein